MHNLPKVEFRQRAVQASDQVIARRVTAVEGLDSLGHIDASAGEVNTTELQWCARIGDTEFAVIDFATQKMDDGQVSISIVALADAVSIGEPGAEPAKAEPTDDERGKAERQQMVVDRLEFAERTASPSGLGEQVAQNASHHLNVQWGPSAGQGQSAAFRQMLRDGIGRGYGGTVRA